MMWSRWAGRPAHRGTHDNRRPISEAYVCPLVVVDCGCGKFGHRAPSGRSSYGDLPVSEPIQRPITAPVERLRREPAWHPKKPTLVLETSSPPRPRKRRAQEEYRRPVLVIESEQPAASGMTSIELDVIGTEAAQVNCFDGRLQGGFKKSDLWVTFIKRSALVCLETTYNPGMTTKGTGTKAASKSRRWVAFLSGRPWFALFAWRQGQPVDDDKIN